MDSCCTQNWGTLSLYARLFSNYAKKMEHFKLSQGDLPFWPINTRCLASRRYLSLLKRLYNLQLIGNVFEAWEGGRVDRRRPCFCDDHSSLSSPVRNRCRPRSYES